MKGEWKGESEECRERGTVGALGAAGAMQVIAKSMLPATVLPLPFGVIWHHHQYG